MDKASPNEIANSIALLNLALNKQTEEFKKIMGFSEINEE